MLNSTTLVIFGASGDLARRKLIPALLSLHRKRRLPEGFRLLGFARTPYDDTGYRHLLETELAIDTSTRKAWAEFASHLNYLTGDPKQVNDLAIVDAYLKPLETQAGGCSHRLYYLATPPEAYVDIIRGLGQTGLARSGTGWRRVVIEKPFGSDLTSARQLNQVVHQVLTEDQVYRIDHYLGKETVQNVLVFRFANSIFEPIWNRRYIDHVQITMAETVGLDGRGRFYDSVGVLRDVFQNHILQLLALVAMEPPPSFNADALRNERAKVLSSIRPIAPAATAKHSARGQYLDYRQEPGVRPDSDTATFGALRLFIDNWRWQGVPFYLRSGKRLARKATEILIQFKSVPHLMFPLSPGQQIRPNALALCLQPDEGIHLQFEVKVPDTAVDMRSVDMDFHYADDFGAMAIPDAYERLLLDALQGDASLFTRADSIELAWALMDPIIEGWQGEHAPPLESYEPGCWGPPGANALLTADGRTWALGCGGHLS